MKGNFREAEQKSKIEVDRLGWTPDRHALKRTVGRKRKITMPQKTSSLNINLQSPVSISEVNCGNVVLCFPASILFNTCLSLSVIFDIQLSQFCVGCHKPNIIVLEKPLRLAILDMDDPAKQTSIIMNL